MRNILVSAYACEPYKGSEQAVGWNIVLQLAKNNNVHVITRLNNRDIINEFLKQNQGLHLTFHYYDTSKYFLKLKNKEKGIYLYYILWQIGIIFLVKKLLKEIKFDYSYHLTFGSIWLPSFLFLFYPNFIWGPVGGGETIPMSFIHKLSLKGKLLQYLRIILKKTIVINPFFYFLASKACLILCRTPDTKSVFPKKFMHKCYILTDGAIEDSIFDYEVKYDMAQSNIKLIVTSRFIHTKNIETIIKAFSIVIRSVNCSLLLIGSGPERKNLNKLIDELSLRDKVEIIDFVPREDVFKFLSFSHIYLFASLKEACNLSLLEAMAVGLPIVCLNWSGMAISTDDSSAIRLDVTNPEQMAIDMAEAIIKLIENPLLREKMGKAGRERVKNVFNWETKGKFIEDLLNKLDRE